MPTEEELAIQQLEIYRRMLPPQQEGLPLALIEQRLTLQQIEIQRLLSDNQQLADSNITLRQELAATHELLQHRQEIPQTETEKDNQIRLFADRVSKLEVDLRAMQSLKDDLEKLMLQRQELSARLQQEVLRAQADALQLAALKSQVDGLQKELQLARVALEQERKVSAEHLLHRQAMERSYHSVLEEVGRLRIELAEINGQKSANTDDSLPQGSFVNENSMQQGVNKNQYHTTDNVTSAGLTDGGPQELPGQAEKGTNLMASRSEWTVHVAPDGRHFYHNAIARITQWEKPAGMVTQEQSRMQSLQQEKTPHFGQYPMNYPAALGPIQSPWLAQNGSGGMHFPYAQSSEPSGHAGSPRQGINYSGQMPSQAEIQRSLQNAHARPAFSQQFYHNPSS